MRKIINYIKKGDTILEVTFAIMVFSLIAVLSMQIMDRDVAMIQGTLESEMARNEIDAQAEALRYIQNSYLSERELADGKREYQNLWLKLSRSASESNKAGSGLANMPEDISQYTSVDCKTYYNSENDNESIHNIFKDNAFVINTRKIDPTAGNIDKTIVRAKNDDDSNNTDYFAETNLYPRVLFTKTNGSEQVNDEDILAEVFPEKADEADRNAQISSQVYNEVRRAEGIWVIAARTSDSHVGNRTTNGENIPEFYDFHIRTCWTAPGHRRPSTIATTIRLYNPEYIEGQTKGNKI